MAIALVGTPQTGFSVTNSFSVSVPTGTTTGHLMIASLSFNTDATITTPSGWTQVTQLGNAAGDLIGMYYKWAGGSEPASYTFSGSASTSSSGILTTYSGVDATTPLDVAAVTASITATSLSLGPITTVTANALLYYVAGARTASDTVNVDAALSTVAQVTTQRRQSAGSETQVSAGTSTARSFSGTTSVARNGILIALRPASVGGSTGDIKYYTGSAFTAKPVKVWTGSAWVVKPVKRWTGSAWVVTNY